ncbi:hypothetical protein PM082_004866 [Marasmius tenuissimus]|nr:hypothetical protein PM082_004866 [Marasmius tenuissimus]
MHACPSLGFVAPGSLDERRSPISLLSQHPVDLAGRPHLFIRDEDFRSSQTTFKFFADSLVNTGKSNPAMSLPITIRATSNNGHKLFTER